MTEPEDYGLSATRTLLQVADSTPPPGFVRFWSDWSADTWADDPRLEAFHETERGPYPGAPGVTHTFTSRGVRIGCRLIQPQGIEPRAIVVTSHGYGMEPGEPLTDESPWTPHGISTLKIRVRGYPGSQLDTGDLTRHELGYVAHGIERPQTWIIGACAADLLNAIRAAKRLVGPSLPVMLHGESFGGGLAVLAASQLAGKLPLPRIVVALPSLGWWAWRLERRAHAGIGLEVERYIRSQRGRDAEILDMLRLFDAAVHARRLTCPVLCKVAERDDVVPAPSAAAVYNAFAADPGSKWRFVTRFGHYDGGLADLRRHALFERLAGAFLNPALNLQELMRRWEPLLTSGEREPQ